MGSPQFLLSPQCPLQLSLRFPSRRQERVSLRSENKRNVGFRSAREECHAVATRRNPSVRGGRDIRNREWPRESCCLQASLPYWFVHQTAPAARLFVPKLSSTLLGWSAGDTSRILSPCHRSRQRAYPRNVVSGKTVFPYINPCL